MDVTVEDKMRMVEVAMYGHRVLKNTDIYTQNRPVYNQCRRTQMETVVIPRPVSKPVD